MQHLIASKVTKSTSFRIATALAVSLGIACGSSDDDASSDSGTIGDGSTKSDAGSLNDAANGQDGSTSADGATKTDAAGDTASPAPVNLGAAGTFAILAKSAVSTVPTSAVTGNLGVSPAAASYITGFSLVADATNVFSTSPQVTGQIYASNYAVPTPSNLTTAVGAMQLAFTDAAGRAPDVVELAAGNIGGRTLTRGVYKWGTGLLVPTDLTLTGSATDVWIFQIAQDLTVGSATKVVLAGGALSKNVFWQVSGKVELGTTSHVEGVVLSQTAIALRTGASVNGRLFAQTAISLESSSVVQPAP